MQQAVTEKLEKILFTKAGTRQDFLTSSGFFVTSSFLNTFSIQVIPNSPQQAILSRLNESLAFSASQNELFQCSFERVRFHNDRPTTQLLRPQRKYNLMG